MPVTCGHTDKKGTYCIWGSHGAHYYYTPGDKASMEKARKKAEAQGRAARASGWTGKGEEMDEECPECDLKALPDVNPNEDEQAYVSRCIKYETEHTTHDRTPEQIQRMCYEKYRSATGKGSKKTQEELKQDLIKIKAELEELKKLLH